MFSLPEFLTFPFSLPSLPSISLPTNIQRRFLSYVLKRALGRFFRSGLDVDEIQSQMGEGRVELEGLVINEEVCAFCPSNGREKADCIRRSIA
jgi:autophagy-related protein 2